MIARRIAIVLVIAVISGFGLLKWSTPVTSKSKTHAITKSQPAEKNDSPNLNPDEDPADNPDPAILDEDATLDARQIEAVFSRGSVAEVLRVIAKLPELKDEDRVRLGRLLCRFYSYDDEQFEIIRWQLLSAKNGPIDLSICEG